jgi:hypothetical protein
MERASTRGERAAALLARSSSRPLGSDRRGQREIQEIIRAVFAAHPSRAFPTKDLCDILYPDLPTRVHIVKTSHAARIAEEMLAPKPKRPQIRRPRGYATQVSLAPR